MSVLSKDKATSSLMLAWSKLWIMEADRACSGVPNFCAFPGLEELMAKTARRYITANLEEHVVSNAGSVGDGQMFTPTINCEGLP